MSRSQNPAPNSVTMQDVADAMGVHRTTVSLALRSHPSIPATTRDRIRKAADEMGYRPNPLVAALMSQQRRGKTPSGVTTMALITADTAREHWRDILAYREMFAGAKAHADRFGFRLEEFSLTQRDMTGRRIREILTTRGIQALLIPPLPGFEDEFPFSLDEFCVMGIGQHRLEPQIDVVDNDHHEAVRLILRKCRERGYRRPGLVVSPSMQRRTGYRWVAAFVLEHWLHSFEGEPRILMAERAGKLWPNGFDQWMDANRPDVLIANFGTDIQDWREHLGEGGKIGLVSLGIREPSYDLAGIDQNHTRTGGLAVELLIGKLQRNETGLNVRRELHLVQGVWHEGSSLPPLDRQSG